MNTFRIATWNLDGYRSNAKSRLPRQLEVLQELLADIVVLTEVRDTTLLPEHFTLSQLQKVVEIILGHPLDKSSFRRRLKTSEDIIETDEFVRGAQRPAQVFRAMLKKSPLLLQPG